jgi:hypothetical protein
MTSATSLRDKVHRGYVHLSGGAVQIYKLQLTVYKSLPLNKHARVEHLHKRKIEHEHHGKAGKVELNKIIESHQAARCRCGFPTLAVTFICR